MIAQEDYRAETIPLSQWVVEEGILEFVQHFPVESVHAHDFLPSAVQRLQTVVLVVPVVVLLLPSAGPLAGTPRHCRLTHGSDYLVLQPISLPKRQQTDDPLALRTFPGLSQLDSLWRIGRGCEREHKSKQPNR